MTIRDAYYTTPEFTAYLAAREVWITAHNEYSMRKCSETIHALNYAQECMDHYLQCARATREHRELFGW